MNKWINKISVGFGGGCFCVTWVCFFGFLKNIVKISGYDAEKGLDIGQAVWNYEEKGDNEKKAASDPDIKADKINRIITNNIELKKLDQSKLSTKGALTEKRIFGIWIFNILQT